jgi:hypothetical protein
MQRNGSLYCVSLYFVEKLRHGDHRYDDFGSNRIVECRAVYWQLLGKHVLAARDTHASIEILLETVFYTRSVQRGYKENN